MPSNTPWLTKRFSLRPPGPEHVHQTEAGTGKVVVLVFILHREGHLDQPIDAANAKRSISSAPLPIAEDVYQLEIRVVYLDGAVVKVGRVQEPEGLGDGQAFVD